MNESSMIKGDTERCAPRMVMIYCDIIGHVKAIEWLLLFMLNIMPCFVVKSHKSCGFLETHVCKLMFLIGSEDPTVDDLFSDDA